MEEAERLQRKKEQVLSSKPKVSSTTLLIVIILLSMVGGGVFLAKSQAKNGPALPKTFDRVKISGPVDYGTRRYDMKTITIEEDADNVILSLADIKKYKMVRFEVKSGGVEVKERNFRRRALPLMAYITPSGYLTPAISYCEPCRSTAFHTDTEMSLVCNVCNTKWTLESEAPIGGACVGYPPAQLKARVVGDKIYLDKKEISNWKPRKEV